MAASSAIRLAAADNVGVVIRDLRPGRDIMVDDLRIAVRDPIPFGHKIALLPIEPGAAVIKFGVPIGKAKMAIERGEHVHIHNIASDYINNAVDHFDG